MLLALCGLASGCAVPNNMPRESRRAYGQLMREDLWHFTPSGFEQTKETGPGCDATWDTMDDIAPSRRMVSRDSQDRGAVVESLRRKAERHGWKVELWKADKGLTASKRVDGRRWAIHFQLHPRRAGQLELGMTGFVRGVRTCHR